MGNYIFIHPRKNRKGTLKENGKEKRGKPKEGGVKTIMVGDVGD